MTQIQALSFSRTLPRTALDKTRRKSFRLGTLLVTAALSLAAAPAPADPPLWASAHGWGKKHHKHKHKYEREYYYPRSHYHDRDDDWDDDEDDNRLAYPRHRGYDDARWNNDYGLGQGYCNRDALGAALGAAAGSALGAYLGDGQTVATVMAPPWGRCWVPRSANPWTRRTAPVSVTPWSYCPGKGAPSGATRIPASITA